MTDNRDLIVETIRRIEQLSTLSDGARLDLIHNTLDRTESLTKAIPIACDSVDRLLEELRDVPVEALPEASRALEPVLALLASAAASFESLNKFSIEAEMPHLGLLTIEMKRKVEEKIGEIDVALTGSLGAN